MLQQLGEEVEDGIKNAIPEKWNIYKLSLDVFLVGRIWKKRG
jgi:hypothetical protein